jgi:hypothetical protein
MRVGILCDNRRWANRREPFRAIAEGLRRLGHEVSVSSGAQGPPWGRLPEVAVLWNGVHGSSGRVRARLRRAGAATLILERGFFDRANHTQIDHAGFNHTASWAGRLDAPAPPNGRARLESCWGPRRVVGPRRKGWVLVLGQVPGDAQLADCELRHAASLVRAIEDATPESIEIRFRPHPLANGAEPAMRRARRASGSLADAAAGARFAVTINSGAGNEALALGCPLLCLGPALYATAGVALRSRLVDLPTRISLMLRGYHPAPGRVENYLQHLACRQWTPRELAQGDALAGLLEAARKESSDAI